MNGVLKRRFTRVRWLAAALILAAMIPLVGQASAGSAKGRFVKVNGHRLYLRCAGTGRPVVLFEAGLGDWNRGWKAVLARSKTIGTTVCAYDRYGLGQSGRYKGSRPVAKVVSDLHALVGKAKLRGPYVLGGSSIGGVIVRSYAKQYPKQVAGMVLFDSVPDDWDQYLGMSVFAAGGEKLNITAAAASLRASDTIGKKPLIVLEAGDESYLEQLTHRPDLRAEYWNPGQHQLAGISSNSLFAVATGKPHWIQSAAPNLSAEAVRLVVASLRAKKALPACAASKLPRLGAACELEPVSPGLHTRRGRPARGRLVALSPRG
ncbi:MAG: alpha/beta fold hydrolase [Gaiellaceae bacterium]